MASVAVQVLAVVAGVTALAAAGLGGAFATSGDFVVAQIACSPDALLDPSSAAVCVDGRVTVGGETCQIANLGLFTSTFDGACADDTAYEISALVPKYTGDPLNFGPLFGAQTNLGGALKQLGITEIPFTTCTEYLSSPVVQASSGGIAAAAIVGGLASYDQQIRGFYLSNTAALFPGLDAVYLQIPNTFISGWNGALGLFYGPISNTSLTTDPYNGTTLEDFILNHAADGLADLIAINGAFAAATPAVSGIVGAFGLGRTPGGSVSTSLLTVLLVGLAVAPGSTPPVAPLSGMSVDGPLAPFNSFVLCSGACTHLEFLNDTIPQLIAIGDTANAARLTTAVRTLAGYLFNSQVADVAFAGTNFDFAQDLLAFFDFALNPSQPANFSAPSGEVIVGTIANAIYDAFYSKAGIQSILLSAAAPGQQIFPPNIDGSNAPLIWGGLCDFFGLAVDCSLPSFISASTAILADEKQKTSLLGLAGAFGACALTGQNSVALCQGVTIPTAAGTEPVRLSILSRVFDAFGYLSETATATTVAELFTQAIPACEDDEKDRAAIASAQVLVPAGIAVVGLSSLGAAAAVMGSPKVAKIGAAAAGVFALVGTVLALVALLGIYGAPIYKSVGSTDTPDDGANVYSTGSALYLALGLIGAGAVSSLAFLGAAVVMFMKGNNQDLELVGKH